MNNHETIGMNMSPLIGVISKMIKNQILMNARDETIKIRHMTMHLSCIMVRMPFQRTDGQRSLQRTMKELAKEMDLAIMTLLD